MTLVLALPWLVLTLTGVPTFEENLGAAKQALSAKDLEGARKLLAAAEGQLAQPNQNSSEARYALSTARGDLEFAAERFPLAARYYRTASHLAEDDRKRRRAALGKRALVATRMKDRRTSARLEELRQHDAELERAWNRPRVGEKELPKLEAKLQAAARLYQRDRDSARAAWARAIASRARALNAADSVAALVHASKAVHLVRRLPAFVRIAALEAGVHAARRASQLERELEFALEHNALTNRTLAPELRPFARTRLLQESCARYEKQEGAGACAVRGRLVTGEWSFVDFSTNRPKAVLEPQDLAAPNAQYLPAVKECVEQVARENAEDELFQEAKVTFSWVVAEDGRTREIEYTPKRYERFFGECVGSAAKLFRYPRSTGERQSVSVSFELSAPAVRKRRGG